MSDLTAILTKAVIADDVSKIARLFAKSTRKSSLLSCRDASGNELIHLASSHGREDIVKILVKLGSDPDKENEYGWTPLMLASFYGRLSVVRFLLTIKSVNPAKLSYLGLNALKCCIYGFHEEVLALLLNQNNIDVNHGGTQGLGMTALMIACKVKNHNAVKSLLFYGSDCNYQSKSNGWTALFYAIHLDDYSIVKLLLSARAEPNLADWSGRTPITVAKSLGCDADLMFGQDNDPEFINDLREMNVNEKVEFGDSSSSLFSRNRRMTNNFQKASFPTDSRIEKSTSNRKFSLNKVQLYVAEGKSGLRDAISPKDYIKIHREASDLESNGRLPTPEKPIKGLWWNTLAKK